MKKLLTTMSAVAVAMSLYAADSGALSGTSFEGLTAGDALNITDPTGELTNVVTTSYWRTNGTDTLTIKEGTSVGAADSTHRAKAFLGSFLNERYLNVKTASPTNAISRYVNDGGAAASINGGTDATKRLYFDSYVRFTAFDGDQTIDLGTGGKLAIWLREDFDAQENPSTNLVITAGYLDTSLPTRAVTTNYNCAVDGGINFNDGGWHRVTVMAMDNIYGSGTATPGFVVFIDGTYAHCTDTTTMGISGTLNGTADFYNSVKALFPSACQSGGARDNISAVDFAGQGDVDELVFTRTMPDFAKDVGIFTIQVPNSLTGIERITFTTNNVTEEISATTTFTITDALYAQGIKIDVEYTDGYMAGTWLGGMTPDPDGYYHPENDGDAVVIVVSAAGASVNGKGFATLADAVEYVNDPTECAPGSGTYTIKLFEAVTDNVVIGNEGITNVLDLAGTNIAVATGAAISLTNGCLIITNSTSTIGVVSSADADPVSVESVSGTSLTIAGGQYDDFIDAQGDLAFVYAGPAVLKLDASWAADEVAGYNASNVQSGYELTSSGDYYVLDEALTGWAALLGRPGVDGAYTIDDKADFLKFQQGVAEGLATAGETFKQTADIDMSTEDGFTGIGVYNSAATKGTPFAGTYDGQGYKIANVKFSMRKYAGIFNQVNGATIKNLIGENLGFSTTVGSGEHGCAIVGNGVATLENLTSRYVNGFSVTNTHNSGGIMVRVAAGGTTTFKNCTNTANLVCCRDKMGGICCFAAGPAVFTNCVNSGSYTLVTPAVSSDYNPGANGFAGILGYAQDASSVSMQDCENTGTFVNELDATQYPNVVRGAELLGYWAASGTLSDLGGNKFNASNKAIDSIDTTKGGTVAFTYATVDNNGVATTVGSAALVKDTTYLAVWDVAPTFALAAVGDYIAFDTALGYTFDGSGITYAAGSVTESTSGTVKTYTAGPTIYTITYMHGATELTGLTPATYTVADAVTLPTEVNLGVTGVAFESWTNAEGTVVSNWVAGAMTGNQTFYAKTYVPGPAYPNYLNGASNEVKGQYDTWAQANHVAPGNNAYEADFLLNVAPGTDGATLDATAISISGMTVTIDINHCVNGVLYVKKAATVAGLEEAPKSAVTSFTPADNIDNGGRITLENESGTAQFYQIGVQSTPLNQNQN